MAGPGDLFVKGRTRNVVGAAITNQPQETVSSDTKWKFDVPDVESWCCIHWPTHQEQREKSITEVLQLTMKNTHVCTAAII